MADWIGVDVFQRICTHPGCTNPHDANGYCTTHNSRIRTHGDPFGKRCEGCGRPLEEVFAVVRSQRYCCDDCRPRCAFAGCGRPVRKLGWCHAHYGQQKHGVQLRAVRAWAEPDHPCEVCGAPPSGGRRRFCSEACAGLFYAHGGRRPDATTCTMCGARIDLHKVGKGGRRRTSRTKLCRDCKTVHVKYGMTVEELAERDGTDCSICGDPVDMTLRRKDSVFCPSVDHRTPRAHGGTDDPDNLALAHFWCNAVKSDREDFTI